MIPLIIDLFAGGGGASTGIEMALGRSPDVAINHDPVALALHAANHQTTRHLRVDVWDTDPVDVCCGWPVGLLWLSPDCKHFSKAKGGRPVEHGIRSLAWVAVRWAAKVRPAVIVLENVEEFTTWGPLVDGRPCPDRKGKTFRAFVHRLEREGYVVEWRELRACDYGAPTTRKRLFLVARRDGRPIVWPEPTHGPGRAEPWHTAAECIDWSLLCPSIFDRPRPLAEATMRRIARGVWRYVIGAARPFIVTNTSGHAPSSVDGPAPTVTTGDHHYLAVPTLIQTGYGEREGQAPRALDLGRPLGTVVSGQKHALISAFLAKHYGGPGGHQSPGSDLGAPAGAVTARDHHGLVAATLVRQFGTSAGADVMAPHPTVMPGGCGKTQLVQAFLVRYYSCGGQLSRVDAPAPTVTTHDRLGLVVVEGQEYEIADIGMRMLQPRELFRAQGFADSYVIDCGPDGRTLSKAEQVRCCGNSVCPPMAAAIVGANCDDLRVTRGQQQRMFVAPQRAAMEGVA